MGTTDASWQYSGWNIDDLTVSAYVCEDAADSDGDGISNAEDNCPTVFNPAQEDYDGDLTGDSCDTCTDLDDDGFGDPGFPASTCQIDNCPSIANPVQEDTDGDTVGDSCDNCIYIVNADQDDSDGNGVGDMCQYACGDVDDSGEVDIDDVVFIIGYIFGGGPSPEPIDAGDTNCSGAIDIDDVVFVIQYIFSTGSEPCDTDGDGIPDC
jgi:hypothetical protein